MTENERLKYGTHLDNMIMNAIEERQNKYDGGVGNMNENKVIDLETTKKAKELYGFLPTDIKINVSEQGLSKAFNDAAVRHGMYDIVDDMREKQLQNENNIDPKICMNEPCEHNNSGQCKSPFCKPVSCMYRMITHPPLSMDYDGYMPSHKEALNMLEKNNLLHGKRQDYLEASIYYGKAESQGERECAEITGITMFQAKECVKTAIKDHLYYMVECGEMSKEDYENIDIEVISRNATLEIEKAMGIYPNIVIK